MDALATKVKETFGKLDVLFVNAGYGHFMPFEAVTEEVYDEMLNLNAKGPYFIVQKLAPLMPEGSSVVFTTSIANVKGVPDLERLWRRQSSASCHDSEHCCRVVAPWNTCECGEPGSNWIDGHNPEGRNAEGGARSGLPSDGGKRSDEASRPAGGSCQSRGIPGD